MKVKKKKRFGDRKDATMVRNGTGMQSIMCHLMPKRADSEVFLSYDIDATALVKYLAEKNSQERDFKLTLFHCIIAGLTKMVNERPMVNRFVQGHRLYQRDDVSFSFVAKRRFDDHAEEALMVFAPKACDTVEDIGRKISGEVKETRKNEHAVDGIDQLVDNFAKIPRIALMGIVRGIRLCDFWGKNPKAFLDGNPYYSTMMLSNLGSIKCPAIYHHLTEYGTTSIFLTIGVLQKKPMVMPDGSIEVRDVLEVGVTLDERIADGFYFVRSLRLIEYIFANPQMLDLPLSTPSGYSYE